MRAKEFILEYNRAVTAQNLGGPLIHALMKDTAAHPLFTQQVGDQLKSALQAHQLNILEKFEHADPTKNKQYTRWIINKYIKQEFLFADLPSVQEHLKKFIEGIKQKLVQNRDLNTYTWAALKQLVLGIYSGKTSQSHDLESDTDAGAQYPVLPGTKVLYNGPQGQLVIPQTQAASQALQKIGHKTSWCTADSRAARHFIGYDEGPLYVWIAADGSKYQFYFPTMEFRDEWNKPLDSTTLVEFLKNHPITSSVLFPNIKKEITKNGVGLQVVPEEFITPALCMLAVKSSAQALEHVPEKFITPEICMLAVERGGQALVYVPEKFITPQLCTTAVLRNGLALQYVPEKFITPQLCTTAVEQYGVSLVHVPEKFRTPELCMLAVKQTGRALEDVPEKLRTIEMCTFAVKNDPQAIQYVPEKIITPELCVLAVEMEGTTLMHVPEKFRTPEICTVAVKQVPQAIRYVPEDFREQLKKELGIKFKGD